MPRAQDDTMSRLYLECYSGISGDMTVGALLDLGADRDELKRVLATVPCGGFTVKISTVQKSAVSACDFNVVLEEENHDHDMLYLYGEDAADIAGHAVASDGQQDRTCCPHSHDHPEHPHGQQDGAQHHHGETDPAKGHCHSHGHIHRSLEDILAIIGGTQMSSEAKELAGRIFQILAKAEAEVHGKPVNEVHFHEVGAVDSIVDIISIAVCYDSLRKQEGITDVIVPILYEGRGTVRTQHGLLPVPVPAVTAIVRDYGIRMHLMPDQGEFVTPTGAAAVAALRTGDELPAEFRVLRTGLGAGKRDYRRAGVLRALLLE